MKLPSKFKKLFKKYRTIFLRILIFRGGRGSGKSRSIATALVIAVQEGYEFVLCTREIQKSIKDSSKRLIENEIRRRKIQHLFHITQVEITYIPNGSQFVFYGLKSNPDSIQSLEGVTKCWIEEARSVSQESLDVLLPTVFREDNSEIWCSYNPKFEKDPVHILANNPPPRTLVVDVNYYDNPFFPEALREQMEWMKIQDYDKYKHIWLGHTLKHSNDQIFYGKWEVREFETPEEQEIFYYGNDWGFSNDPTTLIRCWIDEELNNLMIDYEAYGYKKDLSEIPALFDKVPGSRKYKIRSDNSRPETIRYIMNKGFDIVGAKKGPGSIEEGIEFMKSFNKIIVHTRCPEIAFEFSEYKFKTDPKTDPNDPDVLPVIIDKHNHGIDSVRYATRPLHAGYSDWDTEVR